MAGAATMAGETIIPKLMIGNDNAYLRFYGQVSPGFLVVDNGRSTLGYAPVSNGNATSRLGALLHLRINDAASLGANVEGSYGPYSTKYVNPRTRGDPDWDRYLLRKLEIYRKSDRLGNFWVGQGSMASDGTAEVDLSGTGVIGSSKVSDLAAGQLFAYRGGGLSKISVGGAFRNFDGLSRKVRVRYDTPSFAGFTLSASYGSTVFPERVDIGVWDVALRYAGRFERLRVESAVAYSDNGENATRFDGSISILDMQTGISLTVAAAADGRKRKSERGYLYGKIGYQRQFFPAGIAAFSVDAYGGNEIVGAGSKSRSWGIQAVQNFDDRQAQVYVGYRRYGYSDKAARYDPIHAVLTGARVRF